MVMQASLNVEFGAAVLPFFLFFGTLREALGRLIVVHSILLGLVLLVLIVVIDITLAALAPAALKVLVAFLAVGLEEHGQVVLSGERLKEVGLVNAEVGLHHAHFPEEVEVEQDDSVLVLLALDQGLEGRFGCTEHGGHPELAPEVRLVEQHLLAVARDHEADAPVEVDVCDSHLLQLELLHGILWTDPQLFTFLVEHF